MAATVVSVVIFLCGVLVGRGVKAQVATGVDAAPATTLAETPPTQPQTPAPAPAAGSDPTTAPPPPPASRTSATSSGSSRRTRPPNSSSRRMPAAPGAPASSESCRRRAADADHGTAEGKNGRPGPKGNDSRQSGGPVQHRGASASCARRRTIRARVCGADRCVERPQRCRRHRQTPERERLFRLCADAGQRHTVRVSSASRQVQHAPRGGTVAAKLQKEEQFKPWVTR